VLATYRPELKVTLLEARQRACRFLRDAVGQLDRPDIAVVEARAEEAARRPDLRQTYDAVIARSFGPPAVTAECAVGFLRVGGHLVVSEPPTHEERWPAEGLDALGLAVAVPHVTPEATFVVMEKFRADDRWPRRVGVPAKRPLWSP
jgi:16S rRNA (guanine527-N7)-methyltransferase